MEKAIAFGRTKWLRNLIANRLPEIIDCQDEGDRAMGLLD